MHTPQLPLFGAAAPSPAPQAPPVAAPVVTDFTDHAFAVHDARLHAQVLPVLDDPAVIAGRIEAKLHTAAAAVEEMRAELRAPAGGSDTRPEWVVFIALKGADIDDPGPPRAILRAVGRYAAEDEVARAMGIRADQCFALPALAALRAGAVPLAEHPLRKPAGAPPIHLGDAMEAALGAALERTEAECQRLTELHANILGCSVEEVEARFAAENAEQDQKKKAQATARFEGKATRRQAKASPAREKVPGEGATVADGMRLLTARQVELLALVDVDRKTNRVVYTREEHVTDWSALKQAVEAIGGTWRGKTKNVKGGWAFPDEVDAMDAIRCALDTGGIFDAKLLGFFPTSPELADALVARLAIRPEDRVLEPSAGKGAIALAVRRACPEASIFCVELVPEHQEELRRLGLRVMDASFKQDFLKLGLDDMGPYDVIAMNPPFGKGRVELHHLRHAMGLIGTGARLGAIMPSSLLFRDDALTNEVRAMLAEHDALITDNPRDAFKDAGTMVSTVTVTLTKRRA